MSRRVVCPWFDTCAVKECLHKLPHNEFYLCNTPFVACPTECVDFMFKKDEAEGRKKVNER